MNSSVAHHQLNDNDDDQAAVLPSRQSVSEEFLERPVVAFCPVIGPKGWKHQDDANLYETDATEIGSERIPLNITKYRGTTSSKRFYPIHFSKTLSVNATIGVRCRWLTRPLVVL